MKAVALRSSNLDVGANLKIKSSKSVRCHVVAPVRARLPIDHIKQCAVAAAGSIFLFSSPAAIAMCPDLIAAPDGLQYCDVKLGAGDPPVKGAFIKAHYNGRLDSDQASGTFDSSYERGKPLGTLTQRPCIYYF